MKTKLYKNKQIIKIITLSGALIALAMVLPFLTGAIPEIGNALSPMHIPAFLAGALLGPFMGGAVAAACPILRSLIFGAPQLFPRAVSMSIELLGYAVSFGILLKIFPKRVGYTYAALVISMIVGRIFGGASKLMLIALGAMDGYSLSLFISGYFIESLPGAVLHIITVPPVLLAARRAGIYEKN